MPGVNYNPDVLSCLANLSNDEVFTPPEIANAMLDMLPQELFSDPNAKFLDPACKTGVFLREIAKRLIKGLENKIPNLQERLDHIFHEQLYAIAITELTALVSRRSTYCSKKADGLYSISQFDTPDGNIRYQRTEHKWDGNGRKDEQKCTICGAPRSYFDRGTELESYAYEFIHVEDIYKMKFDLIISNPPYQLNDGGGTGTSAKPIYQLFVEQAKKLRPRYLSMIIPSRWFSGGKGLDEFRNTMLNDSSIRKLVDFENFKEVFPGVDLAGGACYFLWDREYKGLCTVINKTGNIESVDERRLNEFETFIRQNASVAIVRKVIKKHKGAFLDSFVSSRLPFGITTTYSPTKSGIPCYFTQKTGIQFVSKEDVVDSNKLLNKYKFLVPKAPIAGQTDFTKPVGFYYDGNTRIARPGEICSESWLVAGAFDTLDETLSFKSYLLTKTVRFLLLQTVVSQNITKKNFCFIPKLDTYTGKYTDDLLIKSWDITENEWIYISSRIGEIGGSDA